MDTSAAKPTILTQRYGELQGWLQQVTSLVPESIVPLAGDASFRRYYRARIQNKSYVVMDAPPERESCRSFVTIAKTFLENGVKVPEIYAQDVARGFLLLSDLGDDLYSRALSRGNPDELYQRAFATVIKIQTCSVIENYALPPYSETLLRAEMQLFIDWYLKQYCYFDLTKDQSAALEQIFSWLVENALQQPQVCVHRDYHSRNLLVCDAAVGVLDFQDAVLGAITYDLVSLLKDCYVAWPEQQIHTWLQQWYAVLLQQGLLAECSWEQFVYWFDWMGLQRHLKCLGIFTRLYLRDQKPAYLQDLPRVLEYVRSVCQRYPNLLMLAELLDAAEENRRRTLEVSSLSKSGNAEQGS